MSSHHSFNILIAQELESPELAILVHHFQYWVEYNARAKKNFHEGSVWTFQTLESLTHHFPYWNKDKIHRMLSKLVDMKVLKKENFNITSYDRTLWYTFTDEFAEKYKIEKCISQKCEMEIAKMRNRNCENATPIPNDKTDDEHKKEKVKKESRSGSKAPSSLDASRLSSLLFEKMKALDPKFKKPNLEKWASEFDKMNSIDKRSWKEIEDLLEYAFDSWWTGKIQSPKKLREQASRLIIQMSEVQPQIQKENAKEALLKKNREFAKKLQKSYPELLSISDNCVYVKIGKSHAPISYLENGFQEQLDSVLQKAKF